jgi:hypothetical protein
MSTTLLSGAYFERNHLPNGCDVNICAEGTERSIPIAGEDTPVAIPELIETQVWIHSGIEKLDKAGMDLLAI